MSRTNVCPHCGAQNIGENQFCSYCGRKMTKTNHGARNKNSSIIVALLMVLILCIGMYFVFGNKESIIGDPKIEDNIVTTSSNSALYRRSNFTVGNYVTFGHFEQDDYYGNGAEDILWLVLAREGDRAMLMSAYCLYTIPYHQNTSSGFVPWSDCTLRDWLNNTFLSNAFTNAERSAIQTTRVSTPRMPQFDTWPGSSREDKVFILSYQEVERYLSNWSALPTQYARNNGALVNDSRGGTTYWWLRSPHKPGKVSIINSSGNLYYSSVGDRDGTVRPVIWVNLNSSIFE